MRCQDDIVQAAQGRDKFVLVGARLDREHVNGGAQQLFIAQRLGQWFNFHHRAARGVDQDATGLHGGNLGRANHPLGGRQLGHMQADDVALAQQRMQVVHLARIAQRQLVDHVVKRHLHAQPFGQHRQLGAN